MFAGVDIGSRTIKLVELTDGEHKGTVVDTGHSPLDQVEALLEGKGFDQLVVTGYGRHLARMKLTSEVITEIKAFALGVRSVFPGARTILDIGGQDTKAILLNNKGEVKDFEMNDKCAAGTGKFLEVMAAVLGYSLEEFGLEALESENQIKISSMCTVFAESEVISLLHKGIDRSQIAYAVHESIIEKVCGLLKRVGMVEPLVFAGGVAKSPCARNILQRKIKAEVYVPEDSQIIGALGAALQAKISFNA